MIEWKNRSVFRLIKSYAIISSYSPPKGVSSVLVSFDFEWSHRAAPAILHNCTRIWFTVGTLFRLVRMSF